MTEVSLRCHPSVARVKIRELAGKDEQAVESCATLDAIRLIGAVLAETAGDPMTFAAADRDRILAALYIATFGRRIESTVHCTRCGNLFDLNFRLDELVRTLDEQARFSEGGVFDSPSGFRFRLPTAAEEMEAARLGSGSESAEKWLGERCVVEGSPDFEALQAAMEQAAPALDLDLQARCPECAVDQPVRFDIQSYLLNAILQSRPRLWRDVHRIASVYHWSRREILEMSRAERRDLADLIESETVARRRVAL
ncbi:MAG TPA: hypothetical protein VMT58_01745 [Candidatus Binataceae bacterium]|nr:hypothetical protein [Candidatus Binataceae bacterium]